MYDNIFSRVEEKYIITKEQKEQILEKLKPHIEPDKNYPTSNISNVYYDTPNSDLIINSINKPIFKEKVRLRSYGVPNLNDEVFLEMKTKYKGTVGKRRIKLTLQEFYDYIENEKIEDDQIFKELNYLFKYYDLKPKMYIAYDRYSYSEINNKNLRITFDYNIRYRLDNLKLDYNNNGENYFKDETYIMEIKTLNSMPLWLVTTLSELKIFPSSFSKYGSFYKRLNTRGEIKC